MKLAKVTIAFFCIVLFVCVTIFAQQFDNKIVTEKFQEIDTDKDGFITPEEMQAHQRRIFDGLDRNNDNAIDQKELKEDVAQSFKDADKNNDTKINRQEAFAQFNDYFNKMDLNKDNKVSEKEFKEYWPVEYKF